MLLMKRAAGIKESAGVALALVLAELASTPI